MGLSLFQRRKQAQDAPPAKADTMDERFSVYFPRIFAYARSCVGGDIPAQDIAVEAFSEAFKKAGKGNEERFQTALFRAARRRCRSAMERQRSDDDPLSTAEREIISLIFDAGLTREQITKLFRIKESTINSLLMKGLRKLKEETSPAATAAYLKLA